VLQLRGISFASRPAQRASAAVRGEHFP
jgi:hypothetical protein